MCRRCPVSDACSSFALQSGQDAGVWGGLTEEERRIIKRRTGFGRDHNDLAVKAAVVDQSMYSATAISRSSMFFHRPLLRTSSALNRE